VHRRAPVIVTDNQAEPLWEPFRELAPTQWLRACWSTPIFSSGGELLGTFAMYDRSVRLPAAGDEELLKMATHAAAIAIQRARRESELVESEERFAKAFRASPAALSLSRLGDARIVDVNDAFVRLFEYGSPHEILGRSALDLGMWLEPALRDRLVAQLRTAGSIAPTELSFRTRTGEIRHGLCSVERIEIGGEACALSLLIDITERKVAQAELMRAERARAQQVTMLETSLDSLTEGVIVSDLSGEVAYWNRAALAMHGYTSQEECRRRLPEFTETFELALPDGSVVPFTDWPLVRALRGETVRDWEMWLRHRPGRWEKLMMYTSALARDAAGRPLLAVVSMTDITARRQLEEQLRQSQKMDAIGQLAGGIAHDFNNMITAIMLRADLADVSTTLPPAVADAFREIRAVGARAASLTNQLLAFGRRQVMQARPLDLNEVVAENAKMLARLVGEQVRLELQLNLEPLGIHADPGMLSQVLLNLAINARDAMPHGGRLQLQTSACEFPESDGRRPGALPAGRYALFAMIDGGVGIAPEIMPRIFEPFFTTKAVGRGTGLGLATVFGIVHQHRGWVEARSKPGEGATLLVYLPLVAAPLPVPAAAPAAPPRRGSETILLAEDEELVRGTLRRLLERIGYDVLEAPDGPSALALWHAHRARVSLLLTDIVMPGGLSGHELAAKLQADAPALPVILITGYSADIAGRGLALPPRQTLLQKPFVGDDLLAAIRRALAVG
jgi:PAS domain S-box-containing protein